MALHLKVSLCPRSLTPSCDTPTPDGSLPSCVSARLPTTGQDDCGTRHTQSEGQVEVGKEEDDC